VAHWIRTEDGSHVNLDHCVRIAPFSRPARHGGGAEKERAYRIETVGGETVTAEQWAFPEDTMPPVVFLPAAPGDVAVLVYVYDEGRRPVEEDVSSEEVRVRAWAVSLVGPDYVASPVLANGLASGVEVLLREPDGRLLRQHVQTFPDLGTAKREILVEAQEAWDRRNGGPPPQAE
jgi:hypothetical protein